MSLFPCPKCNRHVRVVDTVCPFCASALELVGTPEPRLPRTRLGRSATFAFGASLLSAAGAAACKDTTLPAPVVTETAAPVYGAPPMLPDAAVAPPGSDAGHGESNGSGGALGIASSSGGSPAVVRHPAPIYGGPPPHPSGKPPTEQSKRVLDEP